VSRVLQVALLTSARTWRGSGVSLASIAQGLRDHGHVPRMLAGDDQVLRGFSDRGLPSARVLTGNTGIREVTSLARELRLQRADAVLVDRPRDLRLAALASLAHPLSLVYRYNLSRPQPPRDLLTRLAYRQVSLTIFVSQTSSEAALRFGRYISRRPHRVIRSAVDVDLFRPDAEAALGFRAAHGLGDLPFVLAVGSLTLDKRYDYLLDVWAQAARRLPPLLVLGEGAHGARLRQRARDLGVDARFLGHLPPDALRGAYNAALLVLHAGAVETFGLSVLEAMACGRPVLAVRGGAVPEILGGAGYLVPVDDPKLFDEALREALGDARRSEELGAASRRRVLEHFSLREMRRAYVTAIESAVGSFRSS
jgi:glycosyltransferase involved in cell wall biosynthesis